jgi:hypothetical protein
LTARSAVAWRVNAWSSVVLGALEGTRRGFVTVSISVARGICPRTFNRDLCFIAAENATRTMARSCRRVGVRLSPFCRDGDMHDSEGGPRVALRRARTRQGGIAYIHVVEPRAGKGGDNNAIDPNAPYAAAELDEIFGGPVISPGRDVGDTARPSSAGNPPPTLLALQ